MFTMLVSIGFTSCTNHWSGKKVANTAFANRTIHLLLICADEIVKFNSSACVWMYDARLFIKLTCECVAVTVTIAWIKLDSTKSC
mmetsp:Transcript_26907/g.62921  ORF Transcript_26907/g.62921 Transcript_26907/m.62921 type:complete len:85 (-) Transcript_26907:340-594(-)